MFSSFALTQVRGAQLVEELEAEGDLLMFVILY